MNLSDGLVEGLFAELVFLEERLEGGERHAVHAVVDGVVRDGSILVKYRSGAVAHVFSAALEVDGPDEARMRNDFDHFRQENSANDSASDEPETDVHEDEDGDQVGLEDEADGDDDCAGEENCENHPSNERRLSEIRVNVASLDDQVHAPEHEKPLVGDTCRKEVNSVFRRAVELRGEVVVVKVVNILQGAKTLPQTHDKGFDQQENADNGEKQNVRNCSPLGPELLRARENHIDSPSLRKERSKDDNEGVVAQPGECHASSIVEDVHVDHDCKQCQQNTENNDHTEDGRCNHRDCVVSAVPDERTDQNGENRQNTCNDGECNDNAIWDRLWYEWPRSGHEGLGTLGRDDSSWICE